MTITREQIENIEDRITVMANSDKPDMALMLSTIETWQPALFSWLVAKFSTIESPDALFGVCMTALVLTHDDIERSDQ